MAKKTQEVEPTNKQELLLATFEKKFGKGAVTMGKLGGDATIPRTSSGCIGLDIALGGGYPRGRMVEIYGPESGGKTTLSLHAIAEAQKNGGACAFIDAEHALDLGYASALGVDTEALMISQPNSGEEALEILDMFVRSGEFAIVVVDSVAALVPQAELDGEMSDNQMGLQARLMSKACRKLTGGISASNTLVIFINQLRMKIGGYGNPETPTSGNALKYYASQRLDIRRTGAIKRGEEIIGNETRIKVVKNKVAPPFREVEVRIIYGKGLDYNTDLLRLAVAKDIVKRSGAWYSFQEEKLGQGEQNTTEYLQSNPELAKKIETLVLEDMRSQQPELSNGPDLLQTSEEIIQ